MKRLAALALLCGLISLPFGTAQVPKSTPSDQPKIQRTHYVVKNADPVVLAEVVGKHFKGDADILAAPAGSGNAVLISGSAVTVAEVVKLLELLDCKPRTVEVEVTIVSLPAKKDGTEYTTADLLSDALVKAGQSQRIKLTAVEGKEVTSTTGGNKPYTSVSILAPKGAQRSVAYQPVGTTVKLTARVGTDNAISMDLNVQDSKINQPEAGDETGAPSFGKDTLNTKLSIPAGKAIVAQTIRVDAKSGANVSVVIVTAKVVESNQTENGK
jgi:type II secretory pathway component GspD/PulD (secretin)